MPRKPDFRDALKSPSMLVLFWPGFILALLNSLSYGFLGIDAISLLVSVNSLLPSACYALTGIAGAVWLCYAVKWLWMLAVPEGKGGPGKVELSAGSYLFAVLLFLAFANCINWALVGLLGMDILGSLFAFLPILTKIAYLVMAIGPGIFVLYVIVGE